MKIKKYLLLAITLLWACLTVPQDATCAEYLKLSVIGSNDVNATEEKVFSGSSGYYFTIDNSSPCAVYVFKGNNEIIKLESEEFNWRSFEASWGNGHLLNLEMSINPHNMVIWAVDVDLNSVISEKAHT